MTTTSAEAVKTTEDGDDACAEFGRGDESTPLSTEERAKSITSWQFSEPLRHPELDSEFEEFLFAEKVPMARSLAARLWRIKDFEPISSWQMEPLINREHLVELVLNAAPWDDYFIAYASRPGIRRLSTKWYVAVAFGEPERVRNSAVNFLKFCRRQGLRVRKFRGKSDEMRAELDHAIHYLFQWQHQVARKLIGPILDRGHATARFEDCDDRIPF